MTTEKTFTDALGWTSAFEFQVEMKLQNHVKTSSQGAFQKSPFIASSAAHKLLIDSFMDLRVSWEISKGFFVEASAYQVFDEDFPPALIRNKNKSTWQRNF